MITSGYTSVDGTGAHYQHDNETGILSVQPDGIAEFSYTVGKSTKGLDRVVEQMLRSELKYLADEEAGIY